MRRRLLRRPRGRARPALLAAALVSIAGSAGAQVAPPAALEPARRYVETTMAQDHLPSVAVAVSQHGRIVWEQAFGWADHEARIPATPQTVYPLASITKTLTATGVMVLRQRGRLDLDQPVNRYLGAAKVWSPFWDPGQATVRRVATHTAGLTTYAETCYPGETPCSAAPDEMIRRYAFIGWKPGDHFDYSNVGYGVMGEVLAHGAGQPFAQALRATVLAPLGLTGCVVLPDPRAVTSYGPDGGRGPVREDVQKGASSAACSVHDLVRFGMFSLKDHPSGMRPILSDAALDEMQTRTVAADGGQLYGLGWWVNPDQHGVRVVYGSGGTTDRSAMLYLVPSQDIAVAVLMSTGDSQGISGQIGDRILAALIPAYATDLARPREPATAAPAQPTPENRPASLAGDWTGVVRTWRGERPVRFAVDAAGGARISIGGGPLAEAARARFVGGVLLFRSMAVTDLGTPDANRRPHRLGFELYPVGDGFQGAVTAVPLDSSRDGAVLSYPVSLRRAP